ncbi:MAG TPA: glycosyltransferase family 39 protein [Gemmataceae bacterium]|jgi:4-amino-4-deoxy-L-arabinose transferase-like glycosyltransferase
MDEISPSRDIPSPGRWWREWEVVALAALAFGAYFLRAADLTIRGEESRWATVAMEMIRTGDWVVPRQQGEPFLSRPPLGNWLIAVTTLLRGRCDALAVRLPSVTAVLLTTVLLYAYGRTIMGRTGAFAAGLAFASMGEVLQMGRVAESDIVFASLLSAAWVFWIWGERAAWPAAATWAAGYGLTALAALQKGPQAPVYFAGAVGVYLVARGEWRRLLTAAHGVGLLVFAGVIGAWQVPFLLAEGWEATYRIWLSDSAGRFQQLPPLAVAAHMVTYPIEDLGCTAPWSLLLFAYLSRRFRRGLGAARPVAGFLAACTVLGFLPCWVSPGGMTRYVIPLYPGLALLAGLVIDRAANVIRSPRLQRGWTLGWRSVAAVMAVAPLALAVIRLLPLPVVQAYAPPLATLPAYTLAMWAAAAGVAWGVGRGGRQVAIAAAAVAAFMAGGYATVVVDGMIRRSEDTAAAVDRVKALMPPGTRLVSFAPAHHLFAYYFGEPIELRGLPEADRDRDVMWFCYMARDDCRMPMPFPSEVVAVIPVDRNRQQVPRDIVVVGRRLPAGNQQSARRGNAPGG